MMSTSGSRIDSDGYQKMGIMFHTVIFFYLSVEFSTVTYESNYSLSTPISKSHDDIAKINPITLMEQVYLVTVYLMAIHHYINIAVLSKVLLCAYSFYMCLFL